MRRFILLTSLAVLVVVQAFQWLPLAVLALALWLVVLGRLAPDIMRRVYRPRFWALSIGLGLLSGLFIGEADWNLLGIPFSSTGLRAGGWMVVRGLMLVTVAALAAAALTRHTVTERLAQLGFPNATRTIRTAVQMLPQAQDGLIESWRGKRQAGYHLWQLPRLLDACFLGLVNQAALLAESHVLVESARSGDGTREQP